ncbi:MAG: hypothetical protein GF372_00305 [Candidatus Marinimicrobia bacterium]|nr:hypothetical protein [Candidatus Neomarinimicrobiota bacterium]
MILYPIIFIAGLISGAVVMLVFTAARLNEIEMKNADNSEQSRQRYSN